MEEFFSKEIPARELLKTDVNNISEQELRIIVIRPIAGLEKSKKDSKESIAAEIKGLRNTYDDLRNVANEMQNKWDAVTARMEEAEERIGEIEDKIIENNEAEKRKRKLLDHQGRIRELCDSLKWSNICIIGAPEEKEWKKGAEGLFEQIVAESFPNLDRKSVV